MYKGLVEKEKNLSAVELGYVGLPLGQARFPIAAVPTPIDDHTGPNITFKENVADIRNSKVIEVVKELQQYLTNVQITDPFASLSEISNKYHLPLNDAPSCDYNAETVAINHAQYTQLSMDYFTFIMRPDPILLDLKGIYPRPAENGLLYWRL